MKKIAFKTILFLIISAGLVFAAIQAQSPPASARVASTSPVAQEFFSEQAVDYQLSPAVRDLPTQADSPTVDREINPRHNPLLFEPDMGQRGTWNRTNVPIDPLIATSTNEEAQTPSLDFDFAGTGNPAGCGGCTPPDTVGDVGLNHYIHMVNATKVAVYDKSGTLLNTPVNLGTLWASGVCTSNAGDPIVLYDSLADRWLLSQFAFSSHMCIAISQTSDPLGAYHLYTFNVGSFPDYFKFGVWPDGYYMSANEASYTAYAFERDKMLVGNPSATFQKFTGEDNLLLPADIDGSAPPPTGSPNYFYTFKDNSFHGGGDRLELFEFDVDWNTPANSSFTLATTIPIAAYTYTPCGFFQFNCIRQLDTNQRFDAVAEWPMFRFPYRNFGTHQALVGNFTVGGGAGEVGAAIRWFELRNSGSGWSLYQEGTHDPGDGHDRAMGSITMDGAGNIALGYTVSSSTLYPSIRYATRLASDTLGTLQTEATLIAGGGSQTGSNRWGDYSAMGIDPANDCSFWYTNQYYPATGSTTWQTRVGVFTLAECAAAGTDFTLTADPTTQEVCIPDSAIYTVQVGSEGGYNENVMLSLSGQPAGVTAVFSPNNQPAPYTSTLTLGTVAASPGSYSLDIVGAGPTTTHTTTVQLNLCAPQINVAPGSLSSDQYPDTVVTQTLTISNSGSGPLEWNINEANNDTLSPQPALPADQTPLAPINDPNLRPEMAAFLQDRQPAENLSPLSFAPCLGGTAAGYPCHSINLLSFMPLANIGGGEGNDIWGWTGCNGREFALMGRTNGTAFVEITNPTNPVYLGNLPTHTGTSSWRDIKTYQDYAFVVSDYNGSHGMQIFDLTQLCDIAAPPLTFSESGHYAGFGSAHNLVINEDTGYAYAVGSSTCSGGLHMVDIQHAPTALSAGCFSADGYTHDAQCVIYHGPDAEHQGKEICFNANVDTLTVVDVTDKAMPDQLSRTGYTGSSYAHQGWLTEDHAFYLLDDELDESNFGHNTYTYIWDMGDLDSPIMVDHYTATTAATDHNLYIKGNYAYQSNYRAGLRILDISDIANGNLTEEAYFDIYPANDNTGYNGSWSNYAYFDSGVVAVSGIEQGLYLLQPTTLPTADCLAPSDIPWLAVSPTSGATAENSSSDVAVVFDATGLTPGLYSGLLCIASNDAAMPQLQLPVTLTVSPQPALTITVPVDGAVFTATNVSSITTTVAITTANFAIPDDGRWHLFVDGLDNGPILDYTTTVNLSVGTHVLTATLYSSADISLGITDTVTVTVVAVDKPTFRIYLPSVAKAEE